MMNNMMQIILNNIVNNTRLMQDPRAKRTLELLQNRDSQGLNQMLDNLCKEYGMTREEADKTARQLFRTY